jgi:hypothetical protein
MNSFGSSSLSYGDRDRFMIELSFGPDPVPERATAEERASWGGLRIWVGGCNVCIHYEDGELRDAIHWNWWALLQWLEANWDPLFHEQALPVKNAAEWAAEGIMEINHPATFNRPLGWDEDGELRADAWFRRHCVWSCRDGGLLPNIALRRFHDQEEISWTQHRPPGAPDHFRFHANEGGVRLPVAAVAAPLHQFLLHAAHYVAERAGTDTAARLVKRVESLTATSRWDARLAMLAGFGERTADYAQRFRAQLEKGANALSGMARDWFFPEPREELFVGGHCQGAILFGSVAPVLTDDDRLVLAAAMMQHEKPAADASKLMELVSALTPLDSGDGMKPWDQGYQLAEEWLEVAGVDHRNPLDMERFLAELGVSVQCVRLSDRNTSGAAILLEGRAPLILLNDNCTRHCPDQKHTFRSRIRFTLAHELCHLLVDRTAGANLALVSGPWAPIAIEKRANAFAAALLMPDHLLREAFQSIDSARREFDFDDLLFIAKRLNVSPDALSQHLCNRGYITTEERDALRSQSEYNHAASKV